MPTLTVTGFGQTQASQAQAHQIQADENERLVLALERGGVDILHRCGGVARCTTCRVSFQAGEPGVMTQAEHDKLAEKGLLGEVRLSCQLLCAADMSLTALQTVSVSGLEAGKTPAGTIEPEPVWREAGETR